MAPQTTDGVRRRNVLKAGSAGVVGASTMLAGCAGGGGDGTDSPTAEETTAPPNTEPTATEPQSDIQTGGQIKVALQSDPWTLHPHMYQDTSSSQLANNYGNRLVDLTPNGKLVPDLAEEVPEPTDDGTTYTFKLREGVQFHGDYGEVTAETVVSNYHTILDSEYGSPARADYEGILVGEGIDPEESVQATGEYEVTFNLAKAYAPFLYKLADGRMTVVPPEAIEEYGEDLGTPDVGIWATGPFEFVEAAPDDHYTFDAFDDYFKTDDDGNQLPYLDSVRWNVVPESSVRRTQLKTGGIHISEMVPAQDVAGLQDTENIGINSRPGSSQVNLYINQRTYEPFTSKKMRKALGYGLSKQAVIQTKFKGLAAPGWSLFPQWHWAYDGDAITKYKHDPQKAQSLAEEAGYSDLKFNCSPTNQPLFVDVATIIQQNYSNIGLTMEITPKEKAAAWEPTIGAWDPEAFEPKDQVGPPSTYHSHTEDITYGFDADGYSYITFHTNAWLNVSYYSDDEVDSWLEQARKVSDRETRKELYSKAQAKISDDIPQVMVTWWNVNQGYRSSVNGFNTYPSFAVDLEQVWLSQG